MLSVGNTLAFEACIRTFLNRGESIIMDDYAYTSAVYSSRYEAHIPNGPNAKGLRESTLSEFQRTARG